MSQQAHPHSGHRERLRKRFTSAGLNGFQPHEILELLLCYSIPRKDTNELAHRLLERFGSLSAVFDAPAEQIARVDGIGMHSALLIKLIPAVSSEYLADKYSEGTILGESKVAGNFFMPRLISQSVETMVIALLDNKNKLLKYETLATGSVTQVPVLVRSAVEAALHANASRALLAHNHPSGIAIPSDEDIELTHNVYSALSLIDVALLDHIVVGGNDFISLKESGYLH
ncbi:MAG: DNA repair protein RadC [Oscillospiraceae bacterium]|nr:DNA repair protein RadC [Oscillospiraceae bacterium]MBQ8731961.1 DNA repair protein RadC [Oscillospiraceae bacterium]